MNNYYAPCFYRINFVIIPSYIELPWFMFDCRDGAHFWGILWYIHEL